MKITNEIYMNKTRQGQFFSNMSGTWKEETDAMLIEICKYVYHIALTNLDENNKAKIIEQKRQAYLHIQNSMLNHIKDDDFSKHYETKNEEQTKLQRLERIEVCKKLRDFFKEFDFEPNFRFVNTLKAEIDTSIQDGMNYVVNYFKLSDNQYAASIAEKAKSQEFNNICKSLESIKTTSKINNRFLVMFGPQGTGKTTDALKLSNNVVTVCHSAMLPSDLLEDFDFKDGKATFKKSILWEAMENGTCITLDEINLLPFESLRFLQSILDNKKSINYKGQVINIKDGFMIIGTMNLNVNGAIYNLPEPLVDRAFKISEYRVSNENLANALI